MPVREVPMKIKTLLYVSLAGISLISSMPAGAAPAAGKALFQKLYDKADTAASKKDADGVVANYSTKVVAVKKDGSTQTYADLLDGAQKMFSMASSITSHTTIVSCAVNGSSSVVVQDGATKFSIPVVPGAAPMVIEATSRCRDEWKKSDNGWKIVREVILSDDMKANGRPVGDILGGAGAASDPTPDEPSE